MENPYNTGTENQEDHLSDKQIFSEIWRSPRKVFEYIDRNSYDEFIVILPVLMGLTKALNLPLTEYSELIAKDLELDTWKQILVLVAIVLVVCSFGIILIWFYTHILAAVYRWTGKWLQGVASTESSIRVVAYGYTPLIVGQLLKIFISKPILVYTIDTVFSLWTIIITIAGLSVIHQFSIGKGILNFILAILILASVFGVIAATIYWLFY